MPGPINSVNQLYACTIVPRVLSHGSVEDAILCHFSSGRISSSASEKFKLISVCSAELRGISIIDVRGWHHHVRDLQLVSHSGFRHLSTISRLRFAAGADPLRRGPRLLGTS